MAAAPSWFEDEAFWDDFAPLMFDSRRWAETPDVVDALVALSGLRPGARVLDTCCGPGRHSVELASRGYAVTGVDITPSYLEAAEESAAAAGVRVEFVRADMRAFRRPRSFDLALNLFTSFGYCEDPRDDALILRNVLASLAPGGLFVLEMTGKETAARDFTPGEDFERDGWAVSTRFEVAGHWEGLRTRWTASRDGRTADRSFTQRLYSGVEMKAAFEAAGFEEARVLGTIGGAPYDQDAPSLVAVGRAPRG